MHDSNVGIVCWLLSGGLWARKAVPLQVAPVWSDMVEV